MIKSNPSFAYVRSNVSEEQDAAAHVEPLRASKNIDFPA